MQAHALLHTSTFAEAREKFEELVTHLDSEETLSMTHSELERELESKGWEILRSLLQAHLDSRSPGEANEPVRDEQGIERTEKRMHERDLATLFGEVKVRRAGYGARGRESLHPLDGELNLPPERYSHELRRRAAEEAAKGSFEEAVETLDKYTGTKIPKRQLEQLTARAAQDFDVFYEQREAHVQVFEPEGSFLILSFDGKGVVMRLEDLREETRKAAKKRKHKLGRRLSKGEKKNAKRMASVATVYNVAPFVRTAEQIARCMAPIREAESKRPRPQRKRVWASIEKTPAQVMKQAVEEALRRDPGREKTWVVLVDGNQQQLRILHQLRREYNLDFTVILDIIHVVEYLWKAASTFHDEASQELEAWVSERLLRILCGRASHVAAGIRRSATRRGLSKEQREAADICANYLLRYSKYLHYDQYLEQGLPIATGVIEGVCRHLVRDRMELTGARWSLAGAEAVLRLRALRSSGDFEKYWQFHEAREHERNHAALYADGQVPSTKNTTGAKPNPHLTLVK